LERERSNDAGQVVGFSSDDAAGSNSYATLWDGSSVIDLNTLLDTNGWRLFDALAINLDGQIAGLASFSNQFGDSVERAFLLTPCEGGSCVAADFPVPNLPEPATLPLFAFGLAVMGWFAWRRKQLESTGLGPINVGGQ
jgi:probable HAF family extracellular repeat protein